MIKQPQILVNLSTMAYLWSSSSFDYYLNTFMLKYLNGSMFYNVYASVASEFLGATLSGVMVRQYGLKRTFVFSYLISAVGGIMAIMINSPTSMPFLVMVMRFGIEACFTLTYLANTLIFPVEFAATANGICNVFARFLTVFSSPIAEIAQPMPLVVFSAVAGFGIILSLFIRPR